MFAVSIMLLACSPSWTAATCSPRTPPFDSCVLGGSLKATSDPANLPVDISHCNIVYNKTDFRNQPWVEFRNALKDQTYTLLMIDPDVPNLIEGQYFLHWLQANIKGDNLRIGNLEGSTEITEYLGPAPPAGSGLHRYMFYVYIHLRPSQRVTGPIGYPERKAFNVRTWLQQLTQRGVYLCGPVAGVQFRSGFEQAPTHL